MYKVRKKRQTDQMMTIRTTNMEPTTTQLIISFTTDFQTVIMLQDDLIKPHNDIIVWILHTSMARYKIIYYAKYTYIFIIISATDFFTLCSLSLRASLNATAVRWDARRLLRPSVRVGGGCSLGGSLLCSEASIWWQKDESLSYTHSHTKGYCYKLRKAISFRFFVY